MAGAPVILMEHRYQPEPVGGSRSSCMCGEVLKEDFIAMMGASAGGVWPGMMLSVDKRGAGGPGHQAIAAGVLGGQGREVVQGIQPW